MKRCRKRIDHGGLKQFGSAGLTDKRLLLAFAARQSTGASLANDGEAKQSKPKTEPESLKGWQQIAAFLGQPVAVAQRWARSGMPVEKRVRYVYSSPEALNRWLGPEYAGEPVQIATEETDLGARGLSFIRMHGGKRKRAA